MRRRDARRDPSATGRSRARVFDSASSPSVLARRLAGSIVTTTASRPRRAPSSASTAAVVVLPTPPVPQQTTMCRRSTTSASDVAAAHVTAPVAARRRELVDRGHERVGEALDLRRPDVGGEEERQPDLRQRQALARVGPPARAAPRWRSCRNVRRARRGRRPRVGDERRRPGPRVATAIVRRGVGDRRTVGVAARSRRPGRACTPIRSSSVNAVSTSSLTGVSSGSVTSITWHRVRVATAAPSRRWPACGSGPTRTASSSPCGEIRNVIAWPAAGASIEDQVGGAGVLERLHLAEHEDVLHPGHGRGDDVERPRLDQPLRDPPQAVVLEVVEQRLVGREGAGPDPGRELGLLVAEGWLAEAGRRAPICPRPRRSARSCRCGQLRRASVAVTVVFPTPPLPATITTRADEQKRARSMSTASVEAARLMPPLAAACASHGARVHRARGRRSAIGLARAPRAPVRGRRGTPRGGIDVVQVDGLIDPSNAALIHGAISDANERDATMLVLQIDSGGAVDVDVDSLVRDVRALEGARRRLGRSVGRRRAGRGDPARRGVARSRRSSSGSSIGPASPLSLDAPGDPPPAEVRRRARAALAERHGRDPAGAAPADHREVVGRRRPPGRRHRPGGAHRRRAHRVARRREVVTAGGETRTLTTAKVIGEGVDRRRQPNQEVRFIRLDLGGQLLHTLSEPVDRLPALRRGPRADRVRVLHVRHRPRRARRRGGDDRSGSSASPTSRSTGGRSGS